MRQTRRCKTWLLHYVWNRIVVWTDGSGAHPTIPCIKHAAAAVMFYSNAEVNFVFEVIGNESSSHRGEIEGLCAAIHSIDEPMEVRYDNEYVVNTFCKLLQENSFEPLSHCDVWRAIAKKTADKPFGYHTATWIPAHCNEESTKHCLRTTLDLYLNAQADDLAEKSLRGPPIELENDYLPQIEQISNVQRMMIDIALQRKVADVDYIPQNQALLSSMST